LDAAYQRALKETKFQATIESDIRQMQKLTRVIETLLVEQEQRCPAITVRS
jgi:hypothetical protein